MAAPRILTFNFHEPYLCLMARTGIPLTIGEYDNPPLARKWCEYYRPVPASFTFLDEQTWRWELARGRFDVVIAQNESNAADVCKAVLDTRTPLIMVCHNRRTFLETTIPKNAGNQHKTFLRLIDTLREFAEFVFISETKRADYGVPGRVIRPGIDVNDYGGYTGEIPAVIRVGNLMRVRDRMFDVDFQEAVCAGLANRVIGENPRIPGSEPAKSFDELRAIYRAHRCYLHVTREEYEDGYNLAMLEAMATGMPVVSLANRTSPLTDGKDGFVSYDAKVLRKHIEELLEDLDLAREIGARGRETVAREFPLEPFVETWRETILSAAERSPRHRSQGKSPVAMPPCPETEPPATKLLLHYMASPITTGRYFEQALRKRHDVVTVGRRCPETTLMRWGYPEDVPHYAPQNIDVGINASYQDILQALPEGFIPQVYLWVDSGPKQIAPDIQQLRAAKACYLSDTDRPAEITIKLARHFDFVFVAQRALVPMLQNASIAKVYWLPFACSRDLHNLGILERTLDVSYIGRIQDDPDDRRRGLLDEVRGRFPNHVIGQQWPADMVRTYAQSKIVVNATVDNQLNRCVFEALASGALLITDNADGLTDLFEEGIHFVLYRDDSELCGLIQHYLDDNEARERIARQGQEFVLEHHTCEQRMNQLLGCVFETIGQTEDRKVESRYQDGGYYSSPRAELAAHVPQDAKRILDIGCGAGAFGRSLKQRGAEEVIGIEIEERPCALAKDVLDEALCGDIERMELPFEPGHFDCVTFGDVLEHLVEPDKVLRRIAPLLAPEGLLIASIPNARFCQVVQMLAEGRWKYDDAGILDRTHLRFFTAIEMQLLFEEAGFEVIKMQPLSMLRPDQLPRNADGGFTLGRLTIGPLDDAEYQDFLVYQYLVVARKAGGSHLEHARTALSHTPLAAETAQGAFQRLKASLDVHFDNPPLMEEFVNLGETLGKWEDMESVLRRFVDFYPGNTAMTVRFARVLSRLGKREEAKEKLETVLMFDDKNREARQLFEELSRS